MYLLFCVGSHLLIGKKGESERDREVRPGSGQGKTFRHEKS